MSSKKILVTGGAGFIGSNFCDYILGNTEHSIINLDDLTYAGNKANMSGFSNHARHIFIKGNITDKKLVREIIHTHQPDGVVHLAAETHVDRSIEDPSLFLTTNILGTAVLLDESLDYWKNQDEQSQKSFRFIHVSTDEVFGSIDPPHFFNETTKYNPHSPYAASKAASDHLVRSYHDTYKLPTIVTNCCNNYGPRQFPEKMIPLAIQKLLLNEPIPVYGDGLNIRDWIHVQDHCRGLYCALEQGKPGDTYLFSAMETKSNIELVKLLLSLFADIQKTTHPNLEKRYCFVPDRPGHDRRYALDSTTTQAKLAWYPGISFEQGLLETIRWYLNNQEWQKTVTQNKYFLQRLGEQKSKKD